MANQGQPNASDGGVHASSTDRQSGRGSTNAETGFLRGSRIASPGPENDRMDTPGDLFEPPGQLSTTDPI